MRKKYGTNEINRTTGMGRQGKGGIQSRNCPVSPHRVNRWAAGPGLRRTTLAREQTPDYFPHKMKTICQDEL